MTSPSILEQWSAERSRLAAELAPQAVAIRLGGRRSVSGLHWRDGFVVTAAEALAGQDEVLLVGERGESRERVLACDLATDVALLRTSHSAASQAQESPSPAASMVASAELLAGSGVVIVGREPSGALVSFGSVRLAGPSWRSRRGGEIAQRLEFTADLDGRFEGALVADLAGAVRAMLVAGPRGRLLGIPAATIESVVRAVERHGELPRPYLGVRLQPLWLDEATRTRWGRTGRRIAVVAGVEPDSPAASAGLAPGDLLESLDGTALQDADDFAAQVARYSPGQGLALQIRRGGEPRSIAIAVGRRPVAAG